MKQHVARIIPSNPRRGDSLLFVYGTLRPFVDIPMARWLRALARYVRALRLLLEDIARLCR
jgi:hypothetical protein